MNNQELIKLNQQRWSDVKINPEKEALVHSVAARLVAAGAKEVYQKISALTHVPWWIIAVIHEREASQNWTANIAQGDPWNKVSTHVPKGRGPFKSFVAAAVDALYNCPPYAAKWKDWSIGGALTLLELYNGLGYEIYHHEASPYIWAATNHQEWGKYVADKQWSATVWDQQLGSAAMIKKMMELDPSITFAEKADV